MQSSLKYVLPLLLVLLVASCKEHVTDSSLPNHLPSTFLWLTPDTTVGVGVSRQHLHWYAEDPDGLIRGYLFGFAETDQNMTSAPSPDTLGYTWMTANDTTILFPLNTLLSKFVVVVRGVDAGFEGLPGGSKVRLGQPPFWDKNGNGLFDAGDVALPALTAAMDPKGAVLTFPIRNTPPLVSFAQNPWDPTQVMKQPAMTYPAATFAFTASDPDGNNTLVSYRIALNDTTDPANWMTVSLRDTIVTLVVPRQRSNSAGPLGTVSADVYAGTFLGRRLIGQLPGLKLDALNRFYVEVKDVAGEYSRPAVMPSGTDSWFVKRPNPNTTVLLVNDYVDAKDAPAALSVYRSSLLSAGFDSVDVLDIGQGVTLADKNFGRVGNLVPNFVDPALIQTFLLYDYVVWYTDQQPSLGVAQQTLFAYMQNGGRVIFSTSFVNTADPRGALRDFAPVDSISSVNLTTTIPPNSVGDNRIPANTIVFADSSNPGDIYPQLAFNPTPINHVIYMRPVYRRSDARYIYHLQPDGMAVYSADSTIVRPARNRYVGMPNIGVVDGQGRIVFMGLPLHILDNRIYGNAEGIIAFFKKAITHFNPSQKVDRFRF